MNDKALSGVIMLGAAGALAWAWLTGRLDGTIAQIVGRAKTSVAAVAPSTPATRGESGFGPSGRAGGGAAGGGGGSW